MLSRILNIVLIVILFLAFIVGTFFWFEAEKEVRILCSMFRPGQTEEQLSRTLDTGNLLEYRTLSQNEATQILVDSPYTLGTSRCRVYLSSEGRVVTSDYYQTLALNKVAGWIGAILISGLVIFQLLLAFGKPYGHLAWGGRHPAKLPTSLRAASAFSALILLFAILLLLERTQIFSILNFPNLTYYGVWVLALFFGLSTIANRYSTSETERRVMAPLALLLCALCIIVGMAG